MDPEALNDGSDDGVFEHSLPQIMDDENDSPILMMADRSGVLTVKKVSKFNYKLVADKKKLKIDIFYSVLFYLTDENYEETQLWNMNIG